MLPLLQADEKLRTDQCIQKAILQRWYSYCGQMTSVQKQTNKQTSRYLLTQSCLVLRIQKSTQGLTPIKLVLHHMALGHARRIFNMKETRRSNTNTGFPIYKI